MHIFNHVGDISPIEMKAEMIDGKRYYLTPTGGKYPSITTVISNNAKKQAGLAKWRARVGKDKAQAKSTRAAGRGTRYHKLVEDCSPGTLREVLRGYTGDRSAAQIFDDEEWVEAFPLPRFRGALFRQAGGAGFQRPFELATKRLRNMNEVLRNWRTYVPCDDYITQRGATVLLDADDSVIYCHRDQSLLGYSATMERPLAFLDEVLAQG